MLTRILAKEARIYTRAVYLQLRTTGDTAEENLEFEN